MNLFSKIKENPLLIFQVVLVVLLIVLAIVFAVVLYSKNPEWIFNLLGLSESENPKCEALKFLGVGLCGILVALLYSFSRISEKKRFSKLHYLALKIKEDPLLSFLVFLLVVIFVVLVGVLFSKSLEECIANFMGLTGEKSKRHEALKFLGIGMGGILLALQALMSYRRATAMEKTAEAQVNAVSKTEDGLRQERLKNAIEHLGNEKDSVRLGGAYELFHLAEDNKELCQTVLDILCAHIRQTTRENEYQQVHESKPSEEVQSILRLLFVQEHEVFKGLRIELQGSWLKRADLRNARLQGAILTRAHLQKAHLRLVHLQEAELWFTLLQGTDLSMANLQGTNLYAANLQKADLSEAELQGVDLDRANLQRADLRKANLQGAFLGGANLQGAFLEGTRLEGVISRNWSAATFFEDCIRNQIGKGTDLSGAIFAGGLTREDLAPLVKGLSDEKANELKEKLEPHIGKPVSNELPEDSGAITGAYTEEEAEKWIAEHEEAMSEVPKDDS